MFSDRSGSALRWGLLSSRALERPSFRTDSRRKRFDLGREEARLKVGVLFGGGGLLGVSIPPLKLNLFKKLRPFFSPPTYGAGFSLLLSIKACARGLVLGFA